jgi:translation initiation factor eIF-2B subunit beta
MTLTPPVMLTDNIRFLKRRQIKGSRACASATAYLLLRVISSYRTTDPAKLITRVQDVGRKLCAAQPRELVVGNIVRRILGLIREEAEEDREADFSQQSSDAGSDSRPHTPHPEGHPTLQRPGLPQSSISTFSPLKHGGLEPHDIHSVQQTESTLAHQTDRLRSRPPLLTSHTSYVPGNAPPVTTMFNLLSHPEDLSRASSPGGIPSPRLNAISSAKDIRAEVIEGIHEIIDELTQSDDQIASYALDHIHQNEIILIHTASLTVQKFLLKAAKSRKFHVIHAEAYPNDHTKVWGQVIARRKPRSNEEELSHDAFAKPLTSMGIPVTLLPDRTIFAMMARVNKVILGTHAVLANGGLVASSGTLPICRAARAHKVPVLVVSGVFKLSPVYPFDFDSLIEYGDTSKVLKFEEGEAVEGLEVENPVLDYVPAECVDLYVTNLGGCAPSYLYRVVGDHYRGEDVNF